MTLKPKYVCVIVLIAASMLVSASSHAFRSTKEKSYTDPDYVGYQLHNVILIVMTDDFEIQAAFEKTLRERLAKQGVTIFSEDDLFPPTRQWSQQARAAVYEQRNIDSGIVIGVDASSVSLIPFATHTFSSGNVSGTYNSNSFNAHGTSGSTSYNTYLEKSKANFSALVVELSTGRTVWTSDIFIKSSGSLYVGLKKDARAAAKKIIETLVDNGHVVPDGK